MLPAARPGLDWNLLLGSVAAGAVGSLASLARLLLGNSQVLSTVLWAEDGLFAACAQRSGMWACLLDPYAGYLLAVPRLVAGLVAWLPMQTWPVAMSIAGALLIFLLGSFACAVLRLEGYSWPIAILVSSLPALAPIVGLEALGGMASAYMPLMFALLLLATLPPPGWPAWPLMLLMAVTVLTIPVAVVALLPLWVNWARGALLLRTAVAVSVTALVGLAGQVAAVRVAATQRNLLPGGEFWDAWLAQLPDALLSWFPGLRYGQPGVVFGQFDVPTWPGSGLLLLLAMLLVGGWLAASRDQCRRAPGLLVLTGLMGSAIPSLTAYAGNRYYVGLVLAVGSAALLLVDRASSLVVPTRRRTQRMAVLAAALVVLWVPAYPASSWRSSSGPAWPSQVEVFLDACQRAPGDDVGVMFAPDWPTAATVLTAPTVNMLACPAAAT